ncbi:hypothetical protein GH714_022315 [Hevea brasiliensis]|uniref:Wall-associated receptor kinase galacturonan-binding domain-containing protein n=1 Tax=Hevea brasiliensis TaxID=3981 RepID=A0A6A6KTA5_HEVBR|nr:hypothetical protein GH714_022315 [Hevea brasiliensis]
MGFLALLMFVVLISSIVAPAATQNRSRCSDPCGNLTIPYPFGFDGCYLSPEFLITCNDSFSPPQPFLRKSNIKVTNITLYGKLEIATVAARDCYNQSGAYQGETYELGLSNFTISKSQNKFTVIGCDSYAYLRGFRSEKYYGSGCMSVCSKREFVDENSCSGSGCCQIEIPDGLDSSYITAYSFNNHTNVSNFNPCTYAFIVEDSKFNFSFKYLQNISNTTEFPMVLDWSIKYNTSACKDHAQSYQPPNNISGIFVNARRVTRGTRTLDAKISMNAKMKMTAQINALTRLEAIHVLARRDTMEMEEREEKVAPQSIVTC